MVSLLSHVPFAILFCVLLVLAAQKDVASLNLAVEDDPASIDLPVSNMDIPGSEECIMVPRRTGDKCNAFACYLDGGVCLLEPVRGFCAQHIMRRGWSSPREAPFDKIGSGSCAPCRCAQRKKHSRHRGAIGYARPETNMWTKTEGTAGGQGPGSNHDECRMKSSDHCFATACYHAGGRCEIFGPSGRCLPHVLDSAGVLKRWSWKGLGGPPDCAGGCRCERTHARKRKAGAQSSDAGTNKAKIAA